MLSLFGFDWMGLVLCSIYNSSVLGGLLQLVLTIMNSQVYLGLLLFPLLFVDSFGLPAKGSQAPSYGGGSSTHEPSYVPHRRGSYVQYSSPDLMSQPMHFYVQEPSLSQEVVETVPAPDNMGLVAPGELYPSSSSSSPVQEGYFLGSTQPEAAQPGLPASSWLVAPQSFEEASTNAQAQSTSELLPQPPAGPVLQSGETSNIVKEAELGNYQQETEEFGYPGQPAASEPGFTRLPVPSVVLPGYWGSPYPGFDYRLLYGLYPPGTYSTFSQSHERGKDYYKDVHYLKEHESEEDEGPQQQKVFPGPPQYSTGQQVASRV
ncbi:calcium-binding protein P [Oryzias melastigma]|uniref:calcium-binding protein P n=1 Tax=Oryzias melastigma TaxID=30732 RepID=UPI00168D14EB|nr:calcium-binding protein P [Oryzias melastigma]